MNKPGILKTEVNTPKVVWYQNDDRVVLRIMLMDVKDYFLFVDYDHLRFSTVHNNKNYYLILNLFGTVLPEKVYHKNLGREIRVELPKAHRFLKWLRLQQSAERNFQICLDLDMIDNQDWKMKKNLFKKEWNDFSSFAEFKRKNGLSIYPDVPSSDKESSDDERFTLLED